MGDSHKDIVSTRAVIQTETPLEEVEERIENELVEKVNWHSSFKTVVKTRNRLEELTEEMPTV